MEGELFQKNDVSVLKQYFLVYMILSAMIKLRKGLEHTTYYRQRTQTEHCCCMFLFVQQLTA